MTNSDTIALLRREYERRTGEVGASTGRRNDNLAYAANAGRAAALALAAAAELASILRGLDPEHAADYPDPTPPAADKAQLIAQGLREAADHIATHPELAEHLGTSLQISCYNAPTDEGNLRRVEELAEVLDVTPKWIGTHYQAGLILAGGVQLFAVATGAYNVAGAAKVLPPDWPVPAEPEPEPAPEPEPFVQATPAEVAEAYEDTAPRPMCPECRVGFWAGDSVIVVEPQNTAFKGLEGTVKQVTEGGTVFVENLPGIDHAVGFEAIALERRPAPAGHQP